MALVVLKQTKKKPNSLLQERIAEKLENTGFISAHTCKALDFSSSVDALKQVPQ